MTKVKVLISTMDDLKKFVNIISQFDYDFDLESGRYVVDAKSIMGCFSLFTEGNNAPIDLIIHTDEDTTEVLRSIDTYLIK